MRYDPALPDDRINVSDGSILSEAITLVIGVCLAVAVGATLLSLAIELVIASLPPGLETRLFDGFWSKLETLDDHPHTDRLRELSDDLVEHDQLPRDYFRVAVIESKHPNAMAFPGGLIVFTTALLEAVETENELAFVLGHELGHYRNRDHLRGLGRGLSWALVATALGFGDDAVGALAGLSASLTQRSFDREQELDADLYGLWLLERQYGHAGGTRRVFEVLLARPDDVDDAHEERGINRYLDSHPPHPQRIAALEERAGERGVPVTGIPTPWP